VLPDTIDLSGCATPTFTTTSAGDLIYATCTASNELRIIDVSGRQVVQQLRLAGAPYIGGSPGGMAGVAVSPDKRRIYVVTDTMQVAVVDLPIDSALNTLPISSDLVRQSYRIVPEGLVALTSDGQQLLVATRFDGNATGASEVRIFDAGTLREVGNVPAPQPLVGADLAISSDGLFVFGIGATTNGSMPPRSDTLLRLPLVGGQSETAIVRDGEEIFRIFTTP
jgi:DNA-binding beta-propeller fold protein YncE